MMYLLKVFETDQNYTKTSEVTIGVFGSRESALLYVTETLGYSLDSEVWSFTVKEVQFFDM